ncbi:metallophosphoesterase [Micrococcus sp. IITD107]|uniref:metallophosphoesterase n=1 Tax=Micrococcus sp. IITD107 TaxID=3342790 RepID=UPI0035B95B72
MRARGLLTALGAAAGVTAVAGAGTLAYGALVEARDFQVRRERLEIIPPGGRALRILHLSDIHLMPTQFEKLEWLSTLHTLEPDLVVNTGDNIGSAESIRPLLDALGPLLEVPGVFVPGSNDYYEPRRANPLRYLMGPSKHTHRPNELPWRELFLAFTEHGWIDVTNTHWSRVMEGVRLDVAGTDDPHLERDEWPGFPQGSGTPARSLSIGVTHAPYRRVLDAMVEDGADLIFAGHTHGGQICLPGYGALVTNCDLPTSQASGLSAWTRFERTVPLEVSAGIGAAPSFPVRIACKPEAVVLDLVPLVEPVTAG